MLQRKIQLRELDWNTGRDLGPMHSHKVYSYNHYRSAVWLYSPGQFYFLNPPDPEAVLTVHDVGGELEIEVVRLAWAPITIWLSGQQIGSFPRIEGPSPLTAEGYFALEHIPYPDP